MACLRLIRSAFTLFLFVFELSEFLAVGFHGGVVGDVGVLVDGLFGLFDSFVHGADGCSVSVGFRGVLCPSG